MTDLDTQIAAAAAHLTALRRQKAAQVAPWPKRVTLCVHGSKEENYEDGVALGLEGEALESFMYTTYELRLEYLVAQDGTAQLLTCDGQAVQGEGTP